MQSIFKESGYNLLELTASVTIIAVIACFASPFWQQTLTKLRILQVTKDIESAVILARQLALVEGKDFYLKPLNQQWSSGIEVVAAEANDNAHNRIFTFSYPFLHVSWQGFQYKDKIRFARSLPTASASGHFVIELKGIKEKLVLNRIGKF